MRLSVVIPVYNECKTVERVLQRVAEVGLDTEIIVVDDGSSDGTREILTARPEGEFRLILHERNCGKGAALRTGFEAATGDFVIVQDADLEYDPADYEKLLNLAREQAAIAVYGSRLLVHQPSMSLRHFVGNSLLTGLTNLLYGSHLTDMETCFKLIKRETLQQLNIVSNGFDVEPELTAKLLKQGVEIVELPISYSGRSFAEGKKISWLDFLFAVWTLFRFRLSD